MPQQAEYVVLVEHVEAASNLNADSDYTTPTESIASATLLEVNQPQVLGALTIYPDSTYSYRLTNGLLQAQLVELIQHHPSVTNVIWKARNSFMWEKEFNVFGNSIDEIINRVVTPYGLVVDIYENEVAVVEELRK